ncbi:MAG: 30S ribosome-binding factor RbfA [Pontiellaceae bacterium]
MKRVNELLKREIADNLYRNFANSTLDTASITVTRVECSPDLRDANVYVSIFKDKKNRSDVVCKLNNNKQEITRMMIKNVKLKYTPRLQFHLDESVEAGDNILSILDQLKIDSSED